MLKRFIVVNNENNIIMQNDTKKELRKAMQEKRIPIDAVSVFAVKPIQKKVIPERITI